jgi:hypothetical protein
LKSYFTTDDLPVNQKKQTLSYLGKDIDGGAANDKRAGKIVVLAANGFAITELEPISHSTGRNLSCKQ